MSCLLCLLSPFSFSLLLKRKGDSEVCSKIWQKGNETTLSFTNLDIIQITFPGILSMLHLTVVSLQKPLLSFFLHFSLPFSSSCSLTSPFKMHLKEHTSLSLLISPHTCKMWSGAFVFLPDNDVFFHPYWIKNCLSLALLKQSHVIIIKKMKETCRDRIKRAKAWSRLHQWKWPAHLLLVWTCILPASFVNSFWSSSN